MAIAQNGQKSPIYENTNYGNQYHGSYLYCYLENNRSEQMTMTINFTTMDNLAIGKPNKVNANTIEFVVPSGEKKIAYLKKVDKAGGCSTATSMSYKLE